MGALVSVERKNFSFKEMVLQRACTFVRADPGSFQVLSVLLSPVRILSYPGTVSLSRIQVKSG